MKLMDLEGTFLGDYCVDGGRVSFRELGPTAEGAQGVMFVCPNCFNHHVVCWFSNPRNAPVVPADALPMPGRWAFTGDAIDTVSLLPSVDLSRVDAEHPDHPLRCKWHGWVKSGEAT